LVGREQNEQKYQEDLFDQKNGLDKVSLLEINENKR